MSAISAGVRRFCKDILRQYPLLKRELAVFEEERQAILEAFPSVPWEKPLQEKSLSDPTTRQLFKLLRLEERWHSTRFYVQAVEDLLTYLDEEKRKLVELYYFDGLPAWRVAQKLGIDESTLYRYQAAILDLLARRLGV